MWCCANDLTLLGENPDSAQLIVYINIIVLFYCFINLTLPRNSCLELLKLTGNFIIGYFQKHSKSSIRLVTQFSSVQSLSRVRLFVNPWIAARQASLSITNSRSSLRLMSSESVMPSSHLILCHPLFLLPPNPPSIRVFSNESTLRMRWPKYWSFSFSIIPSKEHPGPISFRMDWLDLLAVQGTLKSLCQHHSSKASILQRSAFFTIQVGPKSNPLWLYSRSKKYI